MSDIGSQPSEEAHRPPRLLVQLWRLKVWTGAAALIGVLAAFLLVYTVHFSPFYIGPRVRPFGVAQTQLLVDSNPSPLADIYVYMEADDQLAFNLAEVGNSPQVRDAAARAVGQPASAIGVDEQVDQEVSRAAANAEEAQAGDTILSSGRQYAVFLRVDANSYVIQIFTQAPTGAEAIRIGNAVAKALQNFTIRLVKDQNIKRPVILRQIFPAYGGDVDPNIALESFVALAAVLIFVALAVSLVAGRSANRRRARPGTQIAET